MVKDDAAFVDLGDIKLCYQVRGDGPRLICISGTNSDLRNKPSMFDAPGASDFEMLCYDHRCMGRSTVPDTTPSMADFAEDAASLLDYLGWSSTAVLGFSFGGMVAQEFALRHPTRVSRMALGCTSSGGRGGSSFAFETLENLNPGEYADKMMELLDNRHDAGWRAREPDEAARIRSFWEENLRKHWSDTAQRAALAKQLAGRNGHDTYDRLSQLKMPVLVCGGEFDAVAPPENSQAVADAIPNSQLNMFQGGHFFMMDDPSAMPKIFEFLSL